MRPAALAGCGLLLELVLLLGFLRPLSIRRYPDAVHSVKFAALLGTELTGALRFAVPALCAFAVFALALWLARGVVGRAAAGLVLGATILFSLTLLPMNPLASDDVYHNVADARTLWLYADNPSIVPPIAHADDPFYPHLSAWLEYPSVYGPVWYVISGAPLPFAHDELWPNIIGQKAITALFLLATTALAMLVAGQIQPRAVVAAGVLVGWNPLLQFETAGNAHNDVVMVFFALAALYAVSRRWWVAVFPLLALSVATKYALVVLGPLLLVWLLRRGDVPRRQVALSLVLGAALGVALYAPFLAGGDTLAGIRRESDHTTSSPGGLLDALLTGRLHLDAARSAQIRKLVLVPPYLLAYLLLLRRIRRNADVQALVGASFWTVFLLLVLVKWWFLPWYLLWLVPLGALLPGSRPALVATAFSTTAMLMYVPHFWLLDRDRLLLEAATAGTAFLLPVLLALAPRLPGKTGRGPAGAPAAD